MGRELGGFLRDRRRALGLRREDVATGAFISFDWYVRVEQGRGHASQDVLERVAETLKLDRAERDYVMALTQNVRHVTGTVQATDALPRSVLRVMHHQAPAPAYIMNTRTDLLAWNESAVEFYDVEFSHLAVEDRNVLWLLAMNDRLRSRILDIEEHVARLVLQCRALWAGRSRDPAIAALVQRLTEASEEFRQRWSEPVTQVLDLVPIRKSVLDSEQGQLTVEQTAWRFGDQSDYILILSSPLDDAGDGTTEKLAALKQRRRRKCL